MGEEDQAHDESVNTGREPRGEAAAGRLREVYDRYARSPRKRRAWAADNPGNVAIRRELRERALGLARSELAGRGRILDLGCGGGWWLQQLVLAGVEPDRLYGVDLLEQRLERARIAVPAAEIRRADARDLPFPDRYFALTFAFTTLSSLPDRAAVRAAVAEVDRTLETGGLLLCYEPRLPNPFNRETRSIRPADLRSVLGGEPESSALTLLPPLARRLGRATEVLYGPLTRVHPLLTHRLFAYRKDPRGG